MNTRELDEMTDEIGQTRRPPPLLHNVTTNETALLYLSTNVIKSRLYVFFFSQQGKEGYVIHTQVGPDHTFACTSSQIKKKNYHIYSLCLWPLSMFNINLCFLFLYIHIYMCLCACVVSCAVHPLFFLHLFCFNIILFSNAVTSSLPI